jgi:hypothetical protein
VIDETMASASSKFYQGRQEFGGTKNTRKLLYAFA